MRTISTHEKVIGDDDPSGDYVTYRYAFIRFDEPLTDAELEHPRAAVREAIEHAEFESRYGGPGQYFSQVGGRLTRWHALVYQRSGLDI